LYDNLCMSMQSWTVSDALWSKLEPLVPVSGRSVGRSYQRRAGAGRKPIDARLVFSAIAYVLRTGCQWKALPRAYGSASSVHKYFQICIEPIFSKALAGRPDRVRRHAGHCLALAGCRLSHGQSPAGNGVRRPEPSRPGKKGRKRSLLVDGRGLPQSIAVSGANIHDSKLLDRTLAQIVVQLPEATLAHQQDLCLDAGYVGYPVRKIARKHGYYLRVKSRAEKRLLKYRYPDSKPRRGVVERTHSWFNR